MKNFHICASAIERAAYLWGPNNNELSDSDHIQALKNPFMLNRDKLWAFVRPAKGHGCGTGGYSISRTFHGGLRDWLGRIKFALKQTQTLTGEVSAIDFVNGLSEQRLRPDMRPLGVSAASKLVFFGAPHLPVFIYDSVVREAVEVMAPKPGHYDIWHRHMKNIDRCATIDQIVFSRKRPLASQEEWFRRRCLDQTLYMIGERVRKARTRQNR